MRRPRGTARGIGRSLRLYYGDPERARRMDALLGAFVGPGDLAFDVGAHVGDRVASLRRLGARVVAVEPQPGAVRALRLVHGRDPGVAIVAAAAGAAPGRARLHLNPANPTVSTLSGAFREAARDAPGWRGERWEGVVPVPVVTLDALAARHGAPAFVKIDVEGFEAEVLAGLSTPPRALSFEFTTIQRGVALDGLERVSRLGAYDFALSLGETHRLEPPGWRPAEAVAHALEALPPEANSGDVYARLRGPRRGRRARGAGTRGAGGPRLTRARARGRAMARRVGCIAGSAVAVALALAPPAGAAPERYEIDPEHTVVSFLVGHVGYASVLGVFLEFEGGFTYDREARELSDLEVTVRTASVETFHEARDEHVRAGDFLDVEAHPAMTFTADGGEPAGEAEGTVTGELTLLGETRPLTLDVTLNKAGAYPFGHGRFTLGISARGTLARSEWGMSYAVDNGLVADEVELVIETEALRVEE